MRFIVLAFLIKSIRSALEYIFNRVKEEVLNGVKRLQNGKSCGTDGIFNKMLQLSVPVLANAYVYIFSHTLRNGINTSMWRENMIKPIYKGSGTMDTNNTRGIAISSCFSKFFCKIFLKDWINI